MTTSPATAFLVGTFGSAILFNAFARATASSIDDCNDANRIVKRHAEYVSSKHVSNVVEGEPLVRRSFDGTLLSFREAVKGVGADNSGLAKQTHKQVKDVLAVLSTQDTFKELAIGKADATTITGSSASLVRIETAGASTGMEYVINSDAVLATALKSEPRPSNLSSHIAFGVGVIAYVVQALRE